MTATTARDVISAEEFNAMQAKAPQRKYRNEPTEVDGRRFDSKAEARRYQELKFRMDAGEIAYIHCQPSYALKVNDMPIAKYIADFEYFDVETMQTVVEDVKSPASRTPVYRLKKKLMLAIHGIEIVEVR